MEENQRGSAASGGGGLGTDDTTLIEVVEPTSSVASGDRLLVHLSCSRISACPGDTPDTHAKFSCFCGGARTSGERDTVSQKKEAEIFEIEA